MMKNIIKKKKNVQHYVGFNLLIQSDEKHFYQP